MLLAMVGKILGEGGNENLYPPLAAITTFQTCSFVAGEGGGMPHGENFCMGAQNIYMERLGACQRLKPPPPPWRRANEPNAPAEDVETE